ncbi:MAG: hypothetical protein LBV40_03750 [Methanomicrobiales archaeon]|jgi:tetratricopeptide (TPR) repeat protein|nr:hypothetical protein [Methanomicrobiales archaeon]
MVKKEPSFVPRRRGPVFYHSHRKQKSPGPGEEFTKEWTYLAHLLENVAKDLSRENNHTQAVELLLRAERIWIGIALEDTQALANLLSLIVSLVRELVVLERVEDAHDACFRTIQRWETHPFSSHQRLLFTHIRYCKALIAVERTLYDEAISEYEAVLSIWKEFSNENTSTFMPVMKQATLALQHLYLKIGDQKAAELLQTNVEEYQKTPFEHEVNQQV